MSSDATTTVAQTTRGPSTDRKTAGVVIIGDEVLSRKVEDANTAAILDAMASHGVDVGEVAMLPDVQPRIAEVVRSYSARFDVVVTTGGVGPTHDDLTWAAVADAFDAPLELNELVWQRMQERLPDGVSDEQRRMAILPRGVRITSEGGAYLFCMRNVYVMPGIPAMVRKAVQVVARRYGSALRALATVYFSRDEWDSVAEVDRLVAQWPALSIGSYPVLDSDDHRHRVTIEGDERSEVSTAAGALIADIGNAHHVRTLWRES